MVNEIEELCKLKDESAFRKVGEGIWKLFVARAFICFAISLVIKWRSPKMEIVQ